MWSSKWYRALSWAIRLLLAGYVVERLVAGDWLGAGSLALFLVLSFAYLLREEGLPNVFDALVSIAAVLNAFGFVFHLYEKVPAYDNVAHACTIFAVTLVFYELVYHDALYETPRHILLLSVFSFGTAVGAVWEIIEWSVEVIFDIQVVFGLDDTATDLITNSTAALLAALVGLFTRRREHSREQAREDAED